MGPRTRTTASIANWIHRRLPRLLRASGVREAYLFGSWARGDADVYSDIDLIIVAQSKRPFVDRFRDYAEIWGSAPTGSDLIVYTPAEFQRQRRESRFVRHVLKHARRVI